MQGQSLRDVAVRIFTKHHAKNEINTFDRIDKK